MQIFDSAISEIETNFGSVLFSANVFDQDDHNAQWFDSFTIKILFPSYYFHQNYSYIQSD